MQLEGMLRKVIEEECDDYFFGVADLSLAKRLLIEQKESLIAEYPKAISIGLTKPPIITNKLSRKNETSTANYKDYDKINQQLNLITTHLSNLLQIEGYKAFSMHVTDKLDNQRIPNDFSHELIANMAGLGRIGKEGLLITPEVGSNVLWGTIFTDAPLKVIEKPLKGYNDLNKLKTIYSSMDK